MARIKVTAPASPSTSNGSYDVSVPLPLAERPIDLLLLCW